jgi:hypothetical protein
MEDSIIYGFSPSNLDRKNLMRKTVETFTVEIENPVTVVGTLNGKRIERHEVQVRRYKTTVEVDWNALAVLMTKRCIRAHNKRSRGCAGTINAKVE